MPWSPKHSDYVQVIHDQNPWIASGSVPEEFARVVRRPLARQLCGTLARDSLPRFQVILGPRRVGKSTVMYQTVAELISQGVPPHRLLWLRLDHPLLMPVALGDLIRAALPRSGASDDGPVYVFLDELTYAKNWDRWLKTFHDERWPIHIAATSSSAAALKQGRVESGVGRWEEQYLAPYLFSEYLELRGRNIDVEIAGTLFETLEAAVEGGRVQESVERERRRFLLIGGFPELITQEPTDDEVSELLRSQRVLRSDAVERAIYKDIPQVFDIREPLKLERLLYTLAGQLGGILSPRTLSSDLGLAAPTFDKYLACMQQSFLIFTLPNFAGSEESIQRRGRKLYFVDGAVRNAALQRGLAPLTDPAEMGLLYENAAASHLHALAQQTSIRLFHWRKTPHEVDLVYDDPNGPVAFEITSSPRHQTAGPREFQRIHQQFRNRCFLVFPDAVPQHPADNPHGIGRLPIDLFLIAVGKQAEAALRQRLTG